jgi:dTDP-glucose pyrophosphorylase
MEDGVERPRAVSEYLVERMLLGGATKICFVVSPGKADILSYYGGSDCPAHLSYVVQARPAGLCDAIFSALPLVHPDESVFIGLPDTIWFPADALARLPGDRLAFLLFPVERPELFDAVSTDESGRVTRIEVKVPVPATKWIWGALRLPGRVLMDLHALWLSRNREDEYLGTLVTAYLEAGASVVGVRGGTAYVDVGTLHGYREAITLLQSTDSGTQIRWRHRISFPPTPVAVR